MASKKELAAEAVELAGGLDVTIDTDGLNHQALTELVSDLRAKTRDAETVTQADQAPVTAPVPETEPVYVVKPGVALTCRVGSVGPGTVIRRQDVAGDGTFDGLVKKGTIVVKA